MADEAKPDEISETNQSEDIAALKAEIEKEKQDALAAKGSSETETPKSGGSLADAQHQKYMDRALGRSTRASLPRFTGNKLEALQAPADGGEGGADAIKSEQSPKEVFEKQRNVESANSLRPQSTAARIAVLIAILALGGAGYYSYMQLSAEAPSKPAATSTTAGAQPAASTKYVDPARGVILLNRAELAMKAQDYKRALIELKKAYGVDPGNRAVYLEKIGECLTRVKEYKGAAAASHDLLELEPTNVNGLLQHAQASYLLGNKISARDDLFKAVQIAPNNAEVFLARGSFYKAENEYSSAELDFKQASKLDPKIVGVKDKLSAVQSAQRAAMAHMKPKVKIASLATDAESAGFTPAQAQQLKSGDLNSLRQAGLQAMTQKKIDFAVAALERCVVINPNDAQSRKLLAYALINAGNASAAFDQFNAWDSLANLGLEDQLAFGRALTKAGDDSTTSAFFSFLADDNSTNAPNLLRIAQIAEKAGSSSSVQKAVDYGLKISSGTTKYQFTVLMRKVQTGQVGVEDAHSSSTPSKPVAQ